MKSSCFLDITFTFILYLILLFFDHFWGKMEFFWNHMQKRVCIYAQWDQLSSRELKVSVCLHFEKSMGIAINADSFNKTNFVI